MNEDFLTTIMVVAGTLAILCLIAIVIVGLIGLLLKQKREDNEDGEDDERRNDDSAVERDRFGRGIFFLFATLICFTIPIIISLILLQPFDTPRLAFVLGFLGSIALYVAVLPKITVYVPLLQGLVAENSLRRGMSVVYGPGIHPRYPWETVHRTSHFSLKDVTNEMEVTIPSRDTEVIIKFLYRWRPDLKRLHIYYGRGITTINRALGGQFESFFVSLIPQLTADQVRFGHRIISVFANRLFEDEEEEENFGNDQEFTVDDRGLIALIQRAMPPRHSMVVREVKALENNYGIDMLEVQITDVDLPQAVQETKDSEYEAQVLARGAMQLLGLDPANADDVAAFRSLDMDTRQHLIRSMMIVSGQGANITIEDFNIGGINKNSDGGTLTALALKALKTFERFMAKRGGGGGGGGKGRGGKRRRGGT